MYSYYHHCCTWQMNLTLIIFEATLRWHDIVWMMIVHCALNGLCKCASNEKKYEKYPDVPIQIIFQLRSFFISVVLCLNFHGHSRVHEWVFRFVFQNPLYCCWWWSMNIEFLLLYTYTNTLSNTLSHNGIEALHTHSRSHMSLSAHETARCMSQIKMAICERQCTSVTEWCSKRGRAHSFSISHRFHETNRKWLYILIF